VADRASLVTERLTLEPIGFGHAEKLWRVGALRRGCPLADGAYDGFLYGLVATDLS
jgi:hypothetical protein